MYMDNENIPHVYFQENIMQRDSESDLNSCHSVLKAKKQNIVLIRIFFKMFILNRHIFIFEEFTFFFFFFWLSKIESSEIVIVKIVVFLPDLSCTACWEN